MFGAGDVRAFAAVAGPGLAVDGGAGQGGAGAALDEGGLRGEEILEAFGGAGGGGPLHQVFGDLAAGVMGGSFGERSGRGWRTDRVAAGCAFGLTPLVSGVSDCLKVSDVAWVVLDVHARTPIAAASSRAARVNS